VWGEVDLGSAPRLAEQLRRADRSAPEIVVDLEGTTFMDCAGMRTLLEAREQIGPARFSVTPGPPQVQRLFQLADVSGMLRVVPRPRALGRHAEAA
jgi:anti-anti-sigma factor